MTIRDTATNSRRGTNTGACSHTAASPKVPAYADAEDVKAARHGPNPRVIQIRSGAWRDGSILLIFAHLDASASRTLRYSGVRAAELFMRVVLYWASSACADPVVVRGLRRGPFGRTRKLITAMPFVSSSPSDPAVVLCLTFARSMADPHQGHWVRAAAAAEHPVSLKTRERALRVARGVQQQDLRHLGWRRYS